MTFPRTQLHADPAGLFLHDVILGVCRRFPQRTALVDLSQRPPRRITYAEYGELVERLARNLVAAGISPGEVIAIYLPNCWEFAAVYHGATLAGAIPTPVNPSYRQRELAYQLADSGAAFLVSDGPNLQNIDLSGLPNLRRLFTTRQAMAGSEPLAGLLQPSRAGLPLPPADSESSVAALPYSSGTTGLPKGVMLSHANLVTNIFQFLAPGEEATFRTGDVLLGFLPLYHIYGLNVVLNPALAVGATLVLAPRFDPTVTLELLTSEGITYLPLVPPVMNALCGLAEQGLFPRNHSVRVTKSGAAPLAGELARRYTGLTGIRVRQGYGMTEASPVTHMGFLENGLYRPEMIGPPLARTECRLLDEQGAAVAAGEAGELVMRGPQFMLGYWNAPQASSEVLRDGCYWSGDVARRDEQGFYQIVDRRKEMIKYKGFAIAPAEVEAVLLEHPLVRDCGVVGRADSEAGEVPCAFVVLRDGGPGSEKLSTQLVGYVAERLTGYKQPREVRFVGSIPRNPSGKVLRRDLRKLL